MILRVAAAAVGLLLIASQAEAQNAAGGWYCQWGTQTTTPGQNPNAAGGEFQMVVYPNGGAEGQGFDSGAQSQIVFQGNWNLDGRGFSIVGQQAFNNGFPPATFNFASNFVSENEMALTIQLEGGLVYASACQRTQ